MSKIYTVSVDHNYPDFEDIVSTMDDGDTVELMPGTYELSENLTLSKKICIQSVFGIPEQVKIMGHITLTNISDDEMADVEFENISLYGTLLNVATVTVNPGAILKMNLTNIYGVVTDAAVFFANDCQIIGNNVKVDSPDNNDGYNLRGTNSAHLDFANSDLGFSYMDNESTLLLDNCRTKQLALLKESKLDSIHNLNMTNNSGNNFDIVLKQGSYSRISNLYKLSGADVNAIAVDGSKFLLEKMFSDDDFNLIVRTDNKEAKNLGIADHSNVRMLYVDYKGE